MTALRRYNRSATAVPDALLNNRGLSFRARGVLAYLLSKPDGWNVSGERIARDGKEGREAITSALRELADAGYYRVMRVRTDDGRFTMVTEISEVPVAAWLSQSPPTGNGLLGAGGTEPGTPSSEKPSSKGSSRENSDPTGHLQEANAVGKPPADDTAQRIAQVWWEDFTPRPSQPFIAARKVIERLLAAGWPPDRVASAVQGQHTLVGARIEDRLRGTAPPGRVVANRHAGQAGPEHREREVVWS